MKKILSVCFLLFIISCDEQNNQIIINSQSIVIINKKYNKNINFNIKNWLIRDIQEDTIPGISLLKAAKKLLKDKDGETIIVALIDMPVDINHEELSPHIWNNKIEVTGNNIDDDKNGYTDDINGWNFIGNSKEENIVFMNYEYTRIIKSYNDSANLDPEIFGQYKKAKIAYDLRKQYAIEVYQKIKEMDSLYYQSKSTINSLLPNTKITSVNLDSLIEKNSNNASLKKAVELFKSYQEKNIDDAYIDESILMAKNRLDILLNIKYNDRKEIGDDVNNIDDSNYGNNIVNHNLNLMTHGTKMAGIIVSNYDEAILEKTMSKIKIMPLCVSGYGDENDKDIALAIRYAVDNGAAIINISSGKYFSMHQNWIHDAIKYADNKNVLIVTSSGNDGLDLNSKGIYKYPNDFSFSTNSEISNNFIRVAGSNYKMDSTFVHPATNYGKTQVDIFAPGEEIYTTSSSKDLKYTYSSGTSASAAVVSKSAAILKSYYPNLKASDLKKILMTTGDEYNLNVRMYDSLDHKINIPFKELSKTGRVVNIYNALVLAESLAKNNSN